LIVIGMGRGRGRRADAEMRWGSSTSATAESRNYILYEKLRTFLMEMVMRELKKDYSGGAVDL
jgi:hypothetical protein